MDRGGNLCAICMKPPTYPCTMLCGHTFCFKRCLLPVESNKDLIQCPFCCIETHVADLQLGACSLPSSLKATPINLGGRVASSRDYQHCLNAILPDADYLAKKLKTLESRKTALFGLKASLLQLRENQVSHRRTFYRDVKAATEQLFFVTDCALEKVKLLLISSFIKEKTQMGKLKTTNMNLIKRQTNISEKSHGLQNEETAAVLKEFELSAKTHLDEVKELRNSVHSCECSGIRNYKLAERFETIHLQLQGLHLISSDSAALMPFIESAYLNTHSCTPPFRRKVEWDVDPNKISVGSLPDLLKDFHLHEYFSKFGIIKDIFVSQGQDTYRLGFVTFRDVDSVKKVLGNQPHQLRGTQVTVSLAKSKRSADNGCPEQNDTGCSKTEDAFADTKDLLLDKDAVDLDPNHATILVSQLKPKFTEADLRAYFSKFGTVAEVEVKINRTTGESRGFGFVTYLDRRSIDSVLNTCHFLDKCRIKVQPAIRHGMSRDHNMHPFNRKMQWKFKLNKIFIRALPKSIKDFHLHEYFSKFGIIKDVFVSEGQHARRCGLITFCDMDSARRVLDEQPHLLNKTQLSVSLGKVKQSADTDDPHPRDKEPKNASIGSKANTSYKGASNCNVDPLSIFVGHLKPTVTDSDLRAYFSKFGTVTEAEVIIDRVRRVSRGFGFVTFADRDDVDVVLASCHFLNERRLNVRPADRHGMQLNTRRNFRNETMCSEDEEDEGSTESESSSVDSEDEEVPKCRRSYCACKLKMCLAPPAAAYPKLTPERDIFNRSQEPVTIGAFFGKVQKRRATDIESQPGPSGLKFTKIEYLSDSKASPLPWQRAPWL